MSNSQPKAVVLCINENIVTCIVEGSDFVFEVSCQYLGFRPHIAQRLPRHLLPKIARDNPAFYFQTNGIEAFEVFLWRGKIDAVAYSRKYALIVPDNHIVRKYARGGRLLAHLEKCSIELSSMISQKNPECLVETPVSYTLGRRFSYSTGSELVALGARPIQL